MKDLKQGKLAREAGADRRWRVSLGCSSTNAAAAPAEGGSATGGTPGSGGGHGGGGAGGKACGGPSPAGRCRHVQLAPCDGVIATFSSADGGIPIMGGVTTWGGFLKPTYTTETAR